jgi:hypothetical protein
LTERVFDDEDGRVGESTRLMCAFVWTCVVEQDLHGVFGDDGRVHLAALVRRSSVFIIITVIITIPVAHCG